jgi:hypothetical protein
MTVDKLASVRRKLARARVHFESFKELSVQISKDNTQYGRQEYNHQLGQYEFHVEDDWTIPEDIPIVIGDSLHNARSALEHLANGLARRPSKRTGFPIFANKTPFACFAGSKMASMKPSAKNIIEGLQPYQRPDGLNSLSWLHDLNNIDKHRAILVTAMNAAGSVATGGFDEDVVVGFPSSRLVRGEIFMTAMVPFEAERQYNYLPVGSIIVEDATGTNRNAEYVLSKILDDIENRLLPAFSPTDFP